MTTLEIILVAILWIGYGVFAFFRTEGLNLKDNDSAPEGDMFGILLIMVVWAPIVLIVRALHGIFKSYK